MRAYRDALTSFIEYTGDILVRELGPDHVRRYIATLSERPGHYQGKTFSSHSLLKHYAVIRTWIRWMYAQKIIEERITDYVKPPRLSTRLPSILTDQEVDAILGDLKKAGRFRDYVIFELFLDTGVRLQDAPTLPLRTSTLKAAGSMSSAREMSKASCRSGPLSPATFTLTSMLIGSRRWKTNARLWLNDHGRGTGYPWVTKVWPRWSGARWRSAGPSQGSVAPM